MSSDVHIANREQALAQAEQVLRHLSEGFVRSGYREAAPSYVRLAQLLAGLHSAEAAPDDERWATLFAMAASSAEILDGMASALRSIAVACSEAVRPIDRAIAPAAQNSSALGASTPAPVPEATAGSATAAEPAHPAREPRTRKAPAAPAKKPRSRPKPTKPAPRKRTP
jgi:hypothetical protein